MTFFPTNSQNKFKSFDISSKQSRKIKNSSALFCDRSGNDSRISSELKSTCGFAEHLDPLYSKINSKIKHQNTED